jgi:hypothetical protein
MVRSPVIAYCPRKCIFGHEAERVRCTETFLNLERIHMSNDLNDIVKFLVQEHGIEFALERASEGVIAAQDQGDNYGLSVWREVRRMLRERGQG